MIDAANILQTISLALAAWTVKTLWAVTIRQAEHEQKLSTHQERLKKLEDKQQCSNP